MWITINRIESTEIDEDVVRDILNLYPEEKLNERNVFQTAFTNKRIEYSDLLSESEKILIPWQMFLLDRVNYLKQIEHIDNERKHKVSEKLVAKRRGVGETTSKRIIDRLIRQQNFVSSTGSLPTNPFCGSIKELKVNDAVQHILKHFQIITNTLWLNKGKGKALEYIINRVETNNINISRGVLTNKILPTSKVVPSEVYRNTSGFVLKDESIPFIFLPSEINPDEVESRQIYTLIYLLVVIGLGEYEFYLEKDFTAKIIGAKGVTARIHAITSEILVPTIETNKLKGIPVTISIRDSLSNKFKVSPLALVTILHIRGIISKHEYDNLKPAPFIPIKLSKDEKRSMPKVSTSVEKFCGKQSYEAINRGIRNGTLNSIQAQYLIFGAVNKKGYQKYRNELGL